MAGHGLLQQVAIDSMCILPEISKFPQVFKFNQSIATHCHTVTRYLTELDLQEAQTQARHLLKDQTNALQASAQKAALAAAQEVINNGGDRAKQQQAAQQASEQVTPPMFNKESHLKLNLNS